MEIKDETGNVTVIMQIQRGPTIYHGSRKNAVDQNLDEMVSYKDLLVWRFVEHRART